MKYVIGIDGGGTKTAFVLADLKGNILTEEILPSISYRECGFAAVEQRLREGIRKVLGNNFVNDIYHVTIGAPGYGENLDGDVLLQEAVQNVLPTVPFTLVNDAEIACWGALSGRPGINVVAGTGSIAFGRDQDGNVARSGGWSEHFSDEGSCYWLGKQAMALFCKEADGREKKAELYEIFSRELKLQKDMDFISVMEKIYLPERSSVAGLQRFLLQAAQAGDIAAQELYTQAAQELCSLAVGVRNQLDFDGNICVSLTGGLLHSAEFVEKPLSSFLEDANMEYCHCEGSPLQGAVLLACSVK